MERMYDCQSEGMHSTKNISPLHQMSLPRVRGIGLTLLGMLGFWLFPVPGAAQIPDNFTTVGPATYLTIPPAVRVDTVWQNTMNDPTTPPQEVPFFPTMDQSVYDALKAGAARKAFTLADHEAATAGVECRKDEGAIDETPGAYKDIDAVMTAQSDLVEVVHTLRQVICVKG